MTHPVEAVPGGGGTPLRAFGHLGILQGVKVKCPLGIWAFGRNFEIWVIWTKMPILELGIWAFGRKSSQQKECPVGIWAFGRFFGVLTLFEIFYSFYRAVITFAILIATTV